MHRGSLITMFLVAATALAGCTGGLQPGDVEMQLTGADQIQLFSLPAQPETEPGDYGVVSAIVTVTEIDAKVNGAWTPLVTTSQTIDLLKLDNKTVSSLGIAKIPQGHVSELRLVLDEIGPYVVLTSGDKKPLEVPVDGIVKVDGKLDLDSCAAGLVILDFDPHIKVEDEPGRREYELTCAAHIKTEELKGACGGADGGAGNDGGGGHGGGGNGGSGGMGGGGGCHGGNGGSGGNGGGADMSGPCDNVVCMKNQTCVVENGGPSCMDTCTSLVCNTPDVCVLVNGNPTCVNPGH